MKRIPRFLTMAAREQRGQALMEFIVFIPFLIGFMSLLVTISSSINGSINQQKAARGYFFHILKGNSTVPLSRTVDSLRDEGATKVGMFAIIWGDKRKGGRQPVAACYKINSMFAGDLEGECDDPMDHSEQKSNYIKVFSVFGLCGNFYSLVPGTTYFQHNVQYGSTNSACVIQN